MCSINYRIDFSSITTDLMTIFDDLRYLTSVLEAKPPSSVKKQDSMWYAQGDLDDEFDRQMAQVF
jgi:hypothetical protein